MELIDRELAERITGLVCGVEGIAGMSAGRFGEVAQLYPGGRVPGLLVRNGRLEIHVAASFSDTKLAYPGSKPALEALADAIQRRLANECEIPVDVSIDDIR